MKQLSRWAGSVDKLDLGKEDPKKVKHDLDSFMLFQITMWGVTIVPSQVALSALQIF